MRPSDEGHKSHQADRQQQDEEASEGCRVRHDRDGPPEQLPCLDDHSESRPGRAGEPPHGLAAVGMRIKMTEVAREVARGADQAGVVSLGHGPEGSRAQLEAVRPAEEPSRFPAFTQAMPATRPRSPPARRWRPAVHPRRLPADDASYGVLTPAAYPLVATLRHDRWRPVLNEVPRERLSSEGNTMPCGRTRPEQFASQREYEEHRLQTMRLILGPDWEDKPLAHLVAEHPELQQRSLHELIAEHEHVPTHAEPTIWRAEVIHPGGQSTEPDTAPTDAPQAIEDGARRQTAEDWLRSYLREHDGSDREG
jgi:hypothetical protein